MTGTGLIDGGGELVPLSVRTVAASANGYAVPVALPGAISLTLSANTARKILTVDETEAGAAEVLVNYAGELNLARIPDAFRADCLGEQTDGNGMKYETAAPVTARFALLFEFDGDQYKTRHVLYNCTASRPAIAGQTVNPDDGPDPSQNTETLTITAAARPDGLVRARCSPGDAAYDMWFEGVSLPAFRTIAY